MKEKIPNGTVIGIILAVVVVIGLIGFKVYGGKSKGQTLAPEEYKTKMEKMQSKQDQNMSNAQNRGPGGGGAGAGGGMSGGPGGGGMSGGR